MVNSQVSSEIPCGYCPSTFTSGPQYVEHLRSAHSDTEQSLAIERDVINFIKALDAATPAGAYVHPPEGVHTYACPYWRYGQKHGQCICGARDLNRGILDAIERLRSRI